MPELPEVETVRAGVAQWAAGRTIAMAEVLHPRAVRRQSGGAAEFAALVALATIETPQRRGKYLWLPISRGGRAPSEAIVVHLGMSGQMLIQGADDPRSVHLRVRFAFTDHGPELRFVDQRTFGGLVVDGLVPTADEQSQLVPSLVSHIARDPLDPRFDEAMWMARMRRSRSELKRTLLDQTMVSGIGNIYADEALWRSRLHGRRAAAGLSRPTLRALLEHVRGVLNESLVQGGTSFDALYVNVNGQSGYFDRRLAVYGREDRPCPRCDTPIRREAFMNRSSFFCPRCQRPPRTAAALTNRSRAGV